MIKIRFKHHIWGFLAILPVWVILAAGCGLPQYAELEKPVAITGLGETIVGFTTPVDDTGIAGYSIYYKIYQDLSDYSTLDDQRYFDENYYINDTDELQPGNSVPLKYGFVRAGILGDTVLRPETGGTVIHNLPGETVQLEFSAAVDPLIRVGVTVQNKLARGYIDLNISNNQLRRFISSDWVFQDIPYFVDGDLLRNPAKQTGSIVSDYNNAGSPLVLPGSGSHSNLVIGFVTFSVGYDASTLSPITSKPVFLGYVRYDIINNSTSRGTESPYY